MTTTECCSHGVRFRRSSQPSCHPAFVARTPYCHPSIAYSHNSPIGGRCSVKTLKARYHSAHASSSIHTSWPSCIVPEPGVRFARVKKVSVRVNPVHDAALHSERYCMSGWALHPLDDAGDRSGAAIQDFARFQQWLIGYFEHLHCEPCSRSEWFVW